MGNGMDKIVDGIYIGSIRDSKDQVQLKENNITHVLSIHDNATKLRSDRTYLCIPARDCSTQDLSQYFAQTNDFIHKARLKDGNVLVHCLAGVSRSVTVTVAYLMTVTRLGWRDTLNAVRGGRRAANPNFGFQRQLLAFEHEKLAEERQRLLQAFGPSPFNDTERCRDLLEMHREWVLHGDSPNKDEDRDTYPLPHRAYGQREAGREPSRNSSREAGRDSSREAGRDSSREAGRDSSREAGRDSSREAGRDSGREAGSKPPSQPRRPQPVIDQDLESYMNISVEKQARQCLRQEQEHALASVLSARRRCQVAGAASAAAPPDDTHPQPAAEGAIGGAAAGSDVTTATADVSEVNSKIDAMFSSS